MKNFKPLTILLVAMIATALLPSPALAQLAQVGKTQKRSYQFEEAGKEMEYTLFASSKVDAAKPAPLLVLLHGLGSNPGQVIRYRGIREEAEKRGYIVVAPYGYNSRGWYGSRGKGKQGSHFGRKGDPDNLGELSEKDVMNVLGIVRKEFKIDVQRIYLAGHSMGGGGTLYLGSSYPKIWAALAPMSPAAYFSTKKLESLKKIPVMIVTGDKDKLVPVKQVRRWVKEMEELGIEHVYEEIKDGNHITSITNNPEMIGRVFDFFDKHQREKSQ
ncbi:MAG: putative peptidase [Verrucomicrobiales bacterium]|jgi:predicted peptidase